MRRGEIWYVDLGEPKGSEPGFRRPVVIVQDDLLTDSRLSTVMIAPVTSNLQRALAAGNVKLDSSSTGLRQSSVVLVCQVMTVDKTLFEEANVGKLSKRQLQELDSGLALALSLTRGT
jgi:mRNA interferase MazF